jgi:hypothetical protein
MQVQILINAQNGRRRTQNGQYTLRITQNHFGTLKIPFQPPRITENPLSSNRKSHRRDLELLNSTHNELGQLRSIIITRKGQEALRIDSEPLPTPQHPPEQTWIPRINATQNHFQSLGPIQSHWVRTWGQTHRKGRGRTESTQNIHTHTHTLSESIQPDRKHPESAGNQPERSWNNSISTNQG